MADVANPLSIKKGFGHHSVHHRLSACFTGVLRASPVSLVFSMRALLTHYAIGYSAVQSQNSHNLSKIHNAYTFL